MAATRSNCNKIDAAHGRRTVAVSHVTYQQGCDAGRRRRHIAYWYGIGRRVCFIGSWCSASPAPLPRITPASNGFHGIAGGLLHPRARVVPRGLGFRRSAPCAIRELSCAGPPQSVEHLRHAARAITTAGHNPLGALSVLAFLAVLLLQAATGLFANDEIANAGPFFGWVSQETSNRLTALARRQFESVDRADRAAPDGSGVVRPAAPCRTHDGDADGLQATARCAGRHRFVARVARGR